MDRSVLREGNGCVMNIVFGFDLDGVCWSERPAAIGQVRTGPLGLLGILETRLGLGRPDIHPVHRIDATVRRIQSTDWESAYYGASFRADAWSTARQLLSWRDELMEAGWDGRPFENGSPRLDGLAALEQAGVRLPSGRADRLQALLSSLREGARVDGLKVRMADPPGFLPQVWQELFLRLEEQGASVETVPTPGVPDDDREPGNLGVVQKALSGQENSRELCPSDDSLVLLRAENEWEAAEQLALWLAAGQQENQGVTIVCGMDTSVLDGVLHRQGLPRLGRSEPSRWRELQQVLPLLLANGWAPLDIRLLAQLLSMSNPVFPRWMCRRLLRAMGEEPGTGGRAWEKAVDGIRETIEKDLREKGVADASRQADDTVGQLQDLLVGDRFDPNTGIPEEKLRERCDRLIYWFGWQADDDPMLREVVHHARELQALSKGKGHISRVALERMLDTIIGAGSRAPDRPEEVAPWQVVDHPAQVIDPCDVVVWWGFNDPLSMPPTWWSDSERTVLEAAGVLVEHSGAFRRREARGWSRGILAARKQFIGVTVQQLDGELAYHHPLWDAICQAAARADGGRSEADVEAVLVRDCRPDDGSEEGLFAGRQHPKRAVTPALPVVREAVRRVQAGTIARPQKMSYSQMSTLIGCPMKWALQYHGGLKVPGEQDIPEGNRMIGTLCHRIVEELYGEGGRHWLPDEARNEAFILYDRLVPALASELLLDGRHIENRRCRQAVAGAIGHLVTAINRYRLQVEAAEIPLERAQSGLVFAGFADLLLRDPQGHPFILDLKWTTSAKYRHQEVEDGQALQLAAYAWMLRGKEAEADRIHTGYFMLAQGRLLSDSPLLGEDALTPACSQEDTWTRGMAAMEDALERLAGGVVEARGVEEFQVQQDTGQKDDRLRRQLSEAVWQKGLLYQRPPCGFCDFGTLCGLTGGHS